jgi:hypothetical protein
MTKTPADGMVELARLAGGFVEAVAEQEAQVLHLMQVEFEAMVRPQPKPVEGAAQDGDAPFDNMPV